MQDAPVGEKSRLVQAVAGAAKKRQGPAAVVKRLFETADADMNEGSLHENLPAQLPVGPFGSLVQLDQRRARLPTLQEGQDEAQACLGGAKAQLTCFGNGDGTS